jgi:hypothetical protein
MDQQMGLNVLTMRLLAVCLPEKGKNENTFIPHMAQSIQGHWQGSNFIVEHLDHWTNTPIATPDTHIKTQWQTENDENNMTMQTMDIKWHHQTTHVDNNSDNPWHTQASLTCTMKTTRATNTRMDMTHLDKQNVNSQPKLAANTFT